VKEPLNGDRNVLQTKQLIDRDNLTDDFIYLKRYMEENISTLNHEETSTASRWREIFQHYHTEHITLRIQNVSLIYLVISWFKCCKEDSFLFSKDCVM
jgi:hypothetical protein